MCQNIHHNAGSGLLSSKNTKPDFIMKHGEPVGDQNVWTVRRISGVFLPIVVEAEMVPGKLVLQG